jgi:hypothetical protein
MGGGSSTPAADPIPIATGVPNSDLSGQNIGGADVETTGYWAGHTNTQVTVYPFLMSSASYVTLRLWFAAIDGAHSNGGNRLYHYFNIYINGATTATVSKEVAWGDYKSVTWGVKLWAFPRINSIRIQAHAEGSSNQYDGPLKTDTGTADIDITINIIYINSTITMIRNATVWGSGAYDGRTCAMLPQNPIKGQIIHIKNVEPSCAYIHAGSKSIDAVSYSTSFSVTDSASGLTITASESGFIMDPYNACTLIYDGTTWCIMNYFDGALTTGYANWGNDPPISPTQITSNVVICDISNADKWVSLPNPAGSIRQLYIISAGSGNSTRYVRLYRGNYHLENNGGTHIYLTADASNKNGCISLLSDGSRWWVLGGVDGYRITFEDTTNGPRTAFSTGNAVNILSADGSGSSDGFTLPVATTVGGLYYLKVRKEIDNNNGIVLDCGASTQGNPISIGNNSKKCFISGAYDYSAAAIYGIKINGISNWYLLSYFAGY